MKTKFDKKNINGILLLNKPQGLTSNAVLQKVKHLYMAKKAGHTGSLDPLATGMLPLCFGEATKISQFLLDSDKCYTVSALLGIKTNTGDAMGETIETKPTSSVTERLFNDAVKTFIGDIMQIPPMFSALKRDGVPLYKLARAGIEVGRLPRQVTINSIEINIFDKDTFKLKVSCSKGTYIRTLIEDIGDKLGVGAHVTELHRVYSAGFVNDRMYSLDELMSASESDLLSYLLPIDRAITHLDKIILSDEDIKMLYQGRVLEQPQHVCFANSYVSLYTKDNVFVGLGDVSCPTQLKAKRLLGSKL
jgi:tRNA pseudouridine55 synthase